jgi:SAM-dependent methyltransferase
MQRIPEPEELMADVDQALAYAEADFQEANRLFVELLEREAGQTLAGHCLDLGCGPADIPIDLLQRHPGLQVDAVDGSPAMLAQAERKLRAASVLGDRIELLCDCLPSAALPPAAYDAVISNSLLHHLADPMSLWRTARQCARPGAVVVVMDLVRPASVEAVDELVEQYAAGAPPVLREDFRNSLFAAYRLDEVEQQLAAAGLADLRVAQVSDRHLAVSGRIA